MDSWKDCLDFFVLQFFFCFCLVIAIQSHINYNQYNHVYLALGTLGDAIIQYKISTSYLPCTGFIRNECILRCLFECN